MLKRICYYSLSIRVGERSSFSWHTRSDLYSYPNTYTDDIRYMYEDMKLRNVVQDVYVVRLEFVNVTFSFSVRSVVSL